MNPPARSTSRWPKGGAAAELAAHLGVSLVRRPWRKGYGHLEGLVVAVDRPMLARARKIRFKVTPVPADATVTRDER